MAGRESNDLPVKYQRIFFLNEKGKGRFVIRYVTHHCLTVSRSNIRGVAHNDIKMWQGRPGCRVKDVDLIKCNLHIKRSSILFSHCQCLSGNIYGMDIGLRQFLFQGDGYAATAGTNVKYSYHIAGIFIIIQNPFNQFFCLRPWDQYCRVNLEFRTIKVNDTCDILQGFVLFEPLY